MTKLWTVDDVGKFFKKEHYPIKVVTHFDCYYVDDYCVEITSRQTVTLGEDLAGNKEFESNLRRNG